MRGDQEGVLADVEFHAGVQRQHDQLARRVAGERDPARPVGHRHDVRHAADVRFIPPPVFSDDSGTDSSFHSSTWCSK